MTIKPAKITQYEYKYLQKRLKFLKNAEKSALSDVKQALKYGSETWHDNDMFDTAKLKQQTVNREIKEVQHLIKHAEVVSPVSTTRVQIGTVVKLQNENDDEYLSLNIGGECTSLLGSGWISLNSPIGLAIVNKKVNDTAVVKTPSGDITYKICDISLIT